MSMKIMSNKSTIELVFNVLSDSYQSTNVITKKCKELGFEGSWNEIKVILEILEENGDVEHIKVGRTHLWKKKGV